MNKTGGFNFQTITPGASNKPSVGSSGINDSFIGSKKVRIPPQLFQGANAKLNQTIAYPDSAA